MHTFESIFNALARPQIFIGLSSLVFALYIVKLRFMMRPGVALTVALVTVA